MIKKQVYLNHMVQRGQYSMVPNELYCAKELKGIAKLIWGYLIAQAPYWESSRNNIARNLGLWPQTVTKYLRQLETWNLLVITKGRRGAFDIQMLPPDQWRIENQIKDRSGPKLAPDRIRSEKAPDRIDIDPLPDRIRPTYKKQKETQEGGRNEIAVGREESPPMPARTLYVPTWEETVSHNRTRMTGTAKTIPPEALAFLAKLKNNVRSGVQRIQ